MHMLSEQDFKRIGEELGLVIEHNLMPQFERMDVRFDKLEKKLEASDNRLGTLEGTVGALPTKAYIEEKLGNLRGDMVQGFRALERRMDRMIDGAPKSELEHLRLYPRPNGSTS